MFFGVATGFGFGKSFGKPPPRLNLFVRLKKGHAVTVSRVTRNSAVAMLLAGSIGLVLTPLLMVSWHEEELLPWLSANLVVAVPVATFVTNIADYSTYGRVYCLVFLFAAVGFIALRGPLEGASRLDRLGTSGSALGLSLCLLGCIADYWLKWMFVFKDTRPTLHFGLGVGYAVSLLLVLLASATYGVAALSPRSKLIGNGWLMIASAPLGLLLSFAHFPSGTMLVLNVCYIDLGRRMMRSDPEGRPSNKPLQQTSGAATVIGDNQE